MSGNETMTATRWLRRSVNGSYWCGNGSRAWDEDISRAFLYQKKPKNTNDKIKAHQVKVTYELGEPEDA